MIRPVRLFFPVIIALAASAVAVFLYYLPMPKPTEEKEYKEAVRRISFKDPESLEEWDEKRLGSCSTEYTVEEIDGRGVLKAVSEASASGLYLKEKLSYRDRPYVKWDWKVEKFPERKNGESLESKKEFDFAAQFYVLFYSRVMLSSQGIQYVWTEEIPVGTSKISPYTKNVKILVLESGKSEEWKTEERDISADYLELFGKKLEKDVVAVAFMTDADSTGTTAEAYFADMEMGYLPVMNTEIQEENEKVTDKGGGH